MGSAVRTDESRLAEIGSPPDACMPKGTCGADGGAVSFWVNMLNCSDNSAGIITTLPFGNFYGFQILCSYENDTTYHIT